ncbi:MAG: DUF2997 domain-containing protein [Phycisphaerae bacterium]|jgi:hypothetical protein|nr:DUF2997 domain-containing protein [Phycisphaerae bacterium]
MSQPEFDITIGKDGTVTVKVTGVSGEECIKLSDMLKEIIGREESRSLTGEFYGPGAAVRIETQVRSRTT